MHQLSERSRQRQPFEVTLDDIPWEAPDDDGSRIAWLEGDRQGGGTFSYAFYLPAGFWDQPHLHTADARIVVVQGQLLLGYGEDMQKERARRYDLGDYLHVPAGVVHYDGAEIDTIILGIATGRWSTTYVDAHS